MNRTIVLVALFRYLPYNPAKMDGQNVYFIIDFDSTFVQVETLELLAEIALKKNPQKIPILDKIRKLTDQGMNGEITYEESLKNRISLFRAQSEHIEKLARLLKRKISPSILRNKEFFKKYKDNIYIISGGFKEYIDPLFEHFGISRSHILANTFRFDTKGYIVGVDSQNPLAHTGGKVKTIKSLNLVGKMYVIGDGYTDYEIKEAGLADKFFVFCENIKREKVADKADYLLPNFDEFLFIMDLPRAYSYPKNRIKALLLENIHDAAIAKFKEEGYEVLTIGKGLNEDELIEVIQDFSILGIRTRTRITPRVLDKAKRLLTVGSFCIGVNNVDVAACARAGIAHFNAPYSNTRSVVELAIGEIVMLYRNIFDKSTKLHKGMWEKSALGSHEIRGKKLGIVGYGNIGSQLSVLAENLGMEVYFYDIVDKLALGNTQKCNSLKDLLKISDVITVHVDGRPENKNLIGRKEFHWMKDNVLFLNLSRGFVVDIDALVENITNGKIKGAAVDVFPQEPKSRDEPFTSKLQNLPNMILTPHIGGSTLEAQENIGNFVSDKIITFLNTGNTTLSTNLPNLQLPKLGNSHRLIHIHQNIPGVLAKINSILAQHNINIEGQYLKTNEEVGYVITDVNKFYNNEVIEKLKKMPETTRLRVLY